VAEYRLDGGTIRFVHTQVEPAFEGRGLGSRLAKAALDEVRSRGLKAVPQCPFIAGYIARHPEYQALVAT
jgi:predicted GNAT family acetyltransferase